MKKNNSLFWLAKDIFKGIFTSLLFSFVGLELAFHWYNAVLISIIVS